VQRAFQPIRKNLLPALSTRFASTEAASSAKDGKIHAVIGAVVDGMFCRENLFRDPAMGAPRPSHWTAHRDMALISIVVKFDTEQLPPILNALTTTNNGQKLILEVAVRSAKPLEAT
jgi:F-type H+-transporting ATPase subunit beta